MAAMSDYLENALLDHSLGKASYTMPTTVYLALFTASPGEDNSGTANELTGLSGYARVAITSTMSAASGGASANGGAITFGPAGASWGTITHVGIYDALTVGNLLYHGALAASKTIGSGDSFQIATGELDITLA